MLKGDSNLLIRRVAAEVKTPELHLLISLLLLFSTFHRYTRYISYLDLLTDKMFSYIAFYTLR